MTSERPYHKYVFDSANRRFVSGFEDHPLLAKVKGPSKR